MGNDNGYDIIFVDDDDATLLNFEQEKYASTTGEIAYWIKTDISSTTDKVINMYYGNSGASDVSTTTGVWDDNFVMVNHLASDGVATTTYPDFLDSTKYNNDGSSINMNSDDLVDGQVDGSLDFDGVNDYVDAGEAQSLRMTTDLTVFVLCYPRDVNGYEVAISKIDSTWITDGEWTIDFGGAGDGILRGYIHNGSIPSEVQVAGTTINKWYSLNLVLNPSALNFYVNGVLQGSASSITLRGTTSNVRIGARISPEQDNFNGLIDEVRISNVARTAGWITTEYNNQSDVASFLTIGAEESLKLDITTDPKVIVAGTESTAFTVQAQDQDGNEMVMGNAVTVNLASDSSGTHHFAATAAGAAVTTVTIPQGESSVNFYYTDYQPGAPTITVTATNYTQNTQQQMSQGSWYDTGYQCRRRITLDADQIATTTDAFPVLATSTLAEMATVANGGCVANDDGRDIIFVDDDNSTLLNYEREKYDPTTGEIAYWIKTDISSTTDKTIYMYYGNSGASDVSTTTGVWDNNFVMVNHLAHNGVATTTYPDFLDSTKYANNGSSVNMNAADLVNGQVDGALDFDGVDDNVEIGTTDFGISDAMSISAWVRWDWIIDNEILFSKADGWGSADCHWFLRTNATGRLIFGDTVTDLIVNSIWTPFIPFHLGVTRTSAGNTTFYINGVNKGSGTSALGTKTTAKVYLGGTYGTTMDFTGLLDEARVSNTVRTAGWITTEYNNQSSVGSFMAIGEEVCMPVPAERSGGGENVKTRIKGGVIFKGGVRF